MNSLDIFKKLFEKYEDVALPPSFIQFLNEQEETRHQLRWLNTNQLLTKFLEQLNVHSKTIGKLLDEDSRLNISINFMDLMKESPEDIEKILVFRFSDIFDLQEVVLDSEYLTGFNRHGLAHLQTVARRMLRLLKETDCGNDKRSKTEKEAVIMGYMHDIGNLISRKYHSLLGAYILTQIFTDYHTNDDLFSSFLRILEGVVFHEIEFGSRLISLRNVQPSVLSLIIADKTDVSFHRVSKKSNVSYATKDSHILVNLLTGDSYIGCQNGVFNWTIRFSPEAEMNQFDDFSDLLKRAERVWVPDTWQKAYRQDNIEYVFLFNATFLKIYFSRLVFAVRAVFSLCPVNSFALQIIDEERGIKLIREFKKDDFRKKLGYIASNLFKNMPDKNYFEGWFYGR